MNEISKETSSDQEPPQKRKEEAPQATTRNELRNYLKTPKAFWYWLTVAATFATAISVFTIPEKAYPMAIIRNVLGTIFILWLPGYTLIKTLFPTTLPTKPNDKELEIIERIALSIGMSIALVPMIGLLLYYTPWGINLLPIMLSLSALTLAFATAALFKEYRETKKQQNKTLTRN